MKVGKALDAEQSREGHAADPDGAGAGDEAREGVRVALGPAVDRGVPGVRAARHQQGGLRGHPGARAQAGARASRHHGGGGSCPRAAGLPQA